MLGQIWRLEHKALQLVFLIPTLQIDTFTCCIDLYWNGTIWVIQSGTLPSWDCPVNSPGGCYDPGTGNGQYSSLVACQAIVWNGNIWMNTSTASWDCGPQGCYDPKNGKNLSSRNGTIVIFIFLSIKLSNKILLLLVTL